MALFRFRFMGGETDVSDATVVCTAAADDDVEEEVGTLLEEEVLVG